MSEKMQGKIKWFNKIKGYGFIEQSTGSDLFVHINYIAEPVDNIQDGQTVSFIIANGIKGLQAEDVTFT